MDLGKSREKGLKKCTIYQGICSDFTHSMMRGKQTFGKDLHLTLLLFRLSNMTMVWNPRFSPAHKLPQLFGKMWGQTMKMGLWPLRRWWGCGGRRSREVLAKLLGRVMGQECWAKSWEGSTPGIRGYLTTDWQVILLLGKEDAQIQVNYPLTFWDGKKTVSSGTSVTHTCCCQKEEMCAWRKGSRNEIHRTHVCKAHATVYLTVCASGRTWSLLHWFLKQLFLWSPLSCHVPRASRTAVRSQQTAMGAGCAGPTSQEQKIRSASDGHDPRHTHHFYFSATKWDWEIKTTLF